MLSAGKNVVLNGSRAAVSAAKEVYPQLKIVQIKVPVEILRNRLKKRKRETEQEIEARLSRATEWRLEEEGLHQFSNHQPMELSIKSFVSLLNRIS